jgi:hypothetical protein
VQYCVASAIDPASAETRFVIVGSDEVLHHEASRWLEFLLALGRSPNTVREYGRRIGWFLSWCSGVVDWRSITLVEETTVHAGRSGDRRDAEGVALVPRPIQCLSDAFTAAVRIGTAPGDQRSGHRQAILSGRTVDEVAGC